MSDFPENDVEILPTFHIDQPVKIISGIVEDLRVPLPPPHGHLPDFFRFHPITGKPVPQNEAALQYLDDRRALLTMLTTMIPIVEDILSGGNGIDHIYDNIAHRQFGLAMRQIENLPADNFPRVNRDTFDSALRDNHVFAIEFKTPPGGGFPEEHTLFLRRYQGPPVGRSVRRRIISLARLVNNHPERRFLVHVLKGECFLGLREFDQASGEYQALLDAPAAFDERQIKFLALRKATIHAAFGDFLFSKLAPEDGVAREAVKEQYRLVQSTLASHNISPDNPVRATLLEHAESQVELIDNGLNALGRSALFIQTSDRTTESFLKEAGEHKAAAMRTRDNFVTYLTAATNLEEKVFNLEDQIDAAEIDIDLEESQQLQIDERVKAIKEQRDAVESKKSFESIVGLGRLIEAGASLAGAAGGGPVTLGVAAVSLAAAEKARQDELSLELSLLGINENIAGLEKSASETRRLRAERHKTFVQLQKDLQVEGRLNTDLYYRLAASFEDLASQHVQLAVASAFEAEARFAYDAGMAALPGKIHFDLLEFTDDHAFMISPDKVAASLLELQRVVDESPTATNFKIPEFSLRERFPLEFSRFQQTGEMDFVISMYDVDRLHPGHTNIRIRGLDIEFFVPAPPEGIRGKLTHQGVFLIRDETSTRDPKTTRLIPKEEEIEQAKQELEKGRNVTIGGVTLMNGGRDEQTLPKLKFEQEPAPDAGKRRIFEGHGITGLWHLRVAAEDNPNLDLTKMADVFMTFFVRSAEPDSDEFETKVRKLLREFEQQTADEQGEDALDRIASFSMKGRFPEAFLQLESGASSIRIGDEEIASGALDSLLKAVVLQVVDEESRGVGGVSLQITKEDTSFELGRVTLADGFTEDVTADVPVLSKERRLPVGGTWALQLSDAGEFSRIADVRWFFVHQLPPLT